MPSVTPRVPRRFPRWLRFVALAQVLLLLGLGGAYLLTLRTPSWWREVPATDPQTAATAEQVENGVVTQLSAVRPADPTAKGYQSAAWSVSVSASDADAWLGTRLRPWIENRGGRWPEQVSSAQVQFAKGAVKLGVRLEGGRVVYIEVVPEVRADGSLWLMPRGMGAGTMPLPAWLVLQQVREGVAGRLPAGPKRAQAEEAIDVLAGKRRLLKDAVLKLEDGRSVRLLKVVPVDGRIEVTCRTEKK